MITVGELVVLASKKKSPAPGWNPSQIDSIRVESCWMQPNVVFLVLGFKDIEGATYMYLLNPGGSVFLSLMNYYKRIDDD
jgi:hypothetical protein